MIPTYKLRDGYQIPQIGFGTWQLADYDVCYDCVRAALDAGYTSIDTATAYGNEEAVGKVVERLVQPVRPGKVRKQGVEEDEIPRVEEEALPWLHQGDDRAEDSDVGEDGEAVPAELVVQGQGGAPEAEQDDIEVFRHKIAFIVLGIFMEKAVLRKGRQAGDGDEHQIEDDVCRSPRLEKRAAVSGGDEKEHNDFVGDNQQAEGQVLSSCAFAETAVYLFFVFLLRGKPHKTLQA